MATISWVGTVSNGGTLTLSPRDAVVVGDGVNPDATLTGGGTVEMTDSTSIGPFAPGSVLTNEDNLITGGGDLFTAPTISVTVVNEVGGQIEADGAGRLLLLTGDVTNEGVLSATNDGLLLFDGISVDNAFGLITADTNAQIVFNDTTLNGGLLIAEDAAVFRAVDSVFTGTDADPLVNAACIDVAAGASLTLSGTIVNTCVLTLETGAALIVDGRVELLGGGDVDLGASSTIENKGPGALLENIDNLMISADGDVATGIGGATISADFANIVMGEVGAEGDGLGQGLLTLSGNFWNYGTLFADTGGKLAVSGVLDNVGDVLVLDSATVAVSGQVVGAAGQILISQNGILDVTGQVGGNVVFDGSGGAVRLSAGGAFVGVWAGAAGEFDLKDVASGAYTLDYVENAGATGGVLTVLDGATPLWSVTVAGRYSVGDFSVGDDGAGGTLVSGGTVTTTEWISGIDGIWTQADQWSAGVPGTFSQAELPSGSYRVNSLADVTVYAVSLAFGSTLRIASGDFWVNGGTGTGSNAGTILVRPGASFNVAGDFQNFGYLNASGTGAVVGLHAAHVFGGQINLGPGAALEASVFGSTITDSTVIGRAGSRGSTMRAGEGGTLAILGGQVIGATLQADGAAPADGFATSSIRFGDTVLDGVTLAGGGKLATLFATFNYLDSVTVAAGATFDIVGRSTVQVGESLTTDGVTRLGDDGGTGILQVSGDTLLAGGGTITLIDGLIETCGCFDARLTSTVTIQGNGLISDDALTLINAGTVAASLAGTLKIDTGANQIGNRGTLRADAGATLTILSDVANTGGLAAAGAGAALQVATVLNDGTITVAVGATATASGALTNRSGGQVTNSGDYDQHAGVTNAGLFTTLAGGFTADGVFSNQGTVSVQGGLWELLDDTLNRRTITVAADGSVRHGDKLTNSAGATVTTAGLYTVEASVQNGGLVELQDGLFSVTGAFANSGTVSVAADATFTVAGAFTNGAGSFTIDGGTAALGQASGGAASLADGGLLSIGGPATMDVLFDPDANTLVLGDSDTYRGQLGGFVDGNLVAFLDMAATDDITFSYSANGGGTGGILRVVDRTAGVTARLQIDGAGFTTSDFVASSYVAPDTSTHFAILSAFTPPI